MKKSTVHFSCNIVDVRHKSRNFPQQNVSPFSHRADNLKIILDVRFLKTNVLKHLEHGCATKPVLCRGSILFGILGRASKLLRITVLFLLLLAHGYWASTNPKDEGVNTRSLCRVFNVIEQIYTPTASRSKLIVAISPIDNDPLSLAACVPTLMFDCDFIDVFLLIPLFIRYFSFLERFGNIYLFCETYSARPKAVIY